MYPKVKVRAVEEDDDFDGPASPLMPSCPLSVRVPNPVKESKHPSSIPIAKVTNPCISRPVHPPDALPKAQISELESVDINRPHIRASSVPRPRAVISSPDNDQLLGSKNRVRSERQPVSKNIPPSKSKQAAVAPVVRCTPSSSGRKSLRRVGECKETNRTKDVGTLKESSSGIRVPRANIVKAKPCFTIT